MKINRRSDHRWPDEADSRIPGRRLRLLACVGGLEEGGYRKDPLSYSDLVQSKERPALVLYHDKDLRQLTVAYITSKTSNLRPNGYFNCFWLSNLHQSWIAQDLKQ